MYLAKIGGGGTKEFVGPQFVYIPYLAMLAIHIVLSIVAVPVVLYAIVVLDAIVVLAQHKRQRIAAGCSCGAIRWRLCSIAP